MKNKTTKKTKTSTASTPKKRTLKKTPKVLRQATAGKKKAPRTQLSAMVSAQLRARTRAYAKSKGVKVSNIVVESITAFLDSNIAATENNALHNA